MNPDFLCYDRALQWYARAYDFKPCKQRRPLLFVLSRLPNKSWRETVAAIGRESGLGAEVLARFDMLIEEGATARDAGFGACWEWDVLPLEWVRTRG